MRRAGILLAATVLAASPSTATAQVDEQEPATNELNLPKDVALLGPRDPAVRKATAIINGTIITDTDVDQRLALVLASSNGKIPDEEKARLRAQVLSNLI